MLFLAAGTLQQPGPRGPGTVQTGWKGSPGPANTNSLSLGQLSLHKHCHSLGPDSTRTTGVLSAGFLLLVFFSPCNYFAGSFEPPTCTSSLVMHQGKCQPSARAALFTHTPQKHCTKSICFLLPPELQNLRRLPNYKILALFFFPAIINWSWRELKISTSQASSKLP